MFIGKPAEFFFSVNPFNEKIPKECQLEYKSNIRDFLVKKWKIRNLAEPFEISHEMVYFVVQKPVLEEKDR